MSNLTAAAETIRQSVSARQAAEALGIQVDRHGRCACPVHQGRDRNCKLWPDNRGFYCYVCHKGGDVIRLVEDTQSCTFQEAIRWLDSAFGLGLDLSPTTDKKRSQAAQNAAMRKRLRERQDRQIDGMLFDLYCIAGKILNDLENDAAQYRPARPYGEWPRQYSEAMRILPEAKDLTEHLATMTIGADK